MKKSSLRDVVINYLTTRKLPILISILYFLIVLVLILNRFWQYEAFYYDHGMMEGSAYQVSHFKLPVIDREGRVPVYNDHFSPSMHLILAPFYWVFDSYETPLFVLAILIGISPLIAYELGLSLKINKIMIYALTFAFMFYIGTQNAIIFLVHDVTLQIPFLLLLFLALAKRNFRFFCFLLLVNLGFKESFSVTGIALGVSLLFLGKNWRKFAIASFLISFTYGLLITHLIIPYFKYITFGVWGSYGYNPYITNPIKMITMFFDTNTKIQTMLVSLTSFGLLPILTPVGLILLTQDFAQRFVLQGATPLRTGLNLYYNANLAVILLFGSYLSLQKLQAMKFYKKVIYLHAFAIVLIIIIFHRVVYHGPFGLLYNKDFFNITRNMKFMDDFVNKIPKNGKIMTQNNLAVRFTHNDLYILSSYEYLEKIQPDVVAIDFRLGQNINNFWPVTPEKMEVIIDNLKSNPTYKIIFEEDKRLIFVKNNY